jgi:hypothetical protein
LIGAGDTQAYTGPRAMVRVVINAISKHKDPFGDPTVDLTSIIKSLQAKDDALEALRESSKDEGDKVTWRKVGDLWYYKNALYVLDDSATYTQLIRVYHNDELAGYFGRNKTK